jgi:aminomuconate-semialdehyde/2-hydroxymuconate-6-semialdehyde dehydrogenase
MEKIENYIGGKFQPPESGNYIENFEPATGSVYSEIADSDERDVEKAVTAAKSAFASWSDLTDCERTEYLNKIAQGIKNRAEEFVAAESKDNGKPEPLARRVDIPRAENNFRFFASAITHFSSEFHETIPSIYNYTLRQPRGVVGAISPWNLPIYLLSWKIAPALAAGNTVVAKPSELSPYTAKLLSEVCIEIGLPDGVLNIVHGYGNKAGEAIVKHPDVSTITFTGGTVTGRKINEIVAPMFKKASLEMGGKNPTLIFDDCDYEKTLAGSVHAAFSNQGEICLCGSRIFVQTGIYESFVTDYVERVKKLKVGDPLEEDTNIGALISEDHRDKIEMYVELAKDEGGEILCGGKRPEKINYRCEDGYFYEPTVITGLDHNCRVNQEEIFGPVVTIIPFETESEVLEWANDTLYGLAGSIWTENVSRAHRVASKLQSGIIWVNCWMVRDLRVPFGGMKNSGVGREGGWEALRFFTEPKNVTLVIDEENK